MRDVRVPAGRGFLPHEILCGSFLDQFPPQRAVWPGRAADVGAVPLAENGTGALPDFQPERPLPGGGPRRPLLQSENFRRHDCRANDYGRPVRRLNLPNELASRAETSDHAFGWFALALLAGFAMLVQGYHPGLEDDAFYLAAIKQDLNPSLFPHDADFFRVQFQATLFDKVVAFSLRSTHVPLAWGILFWQYGVTCLILWGCWRISRKCFVEAHAQWAAVTLVAVLLSLPVSGTGLSLTDQHLHPRALATALILAAIATLLGPTNPRKEVPEKDTRMLLAGALLLAAFTVHAIMA